MIDELFGAGLAGEPDPVARVARLFRLSAAFNADDRSYGRFLTTLVVEGFRDPELAPLAQAEVDRFRDFYGRTVDDALAAGAEIPIPPASSTCCSRCNGAWGCSPPSSATPSACEPPSRYSSSRWPRGCLTRVLDDVFAPRRPVEHCGRCGHNWCSRTTALGWR